MSEIINSHILIALLPEEESWYMINNSSVIWLTYFFYFSSDTEVESVLHDIAEAESINWDTRALVLVGRDTRYNFCICFSVKWNLHSVINKVSSQ